MNAKNLVALSENELESISGGVTGKEVAGTVVEYGTAVVSVVLLGTVGQLLGTGIDAKLDGEDFFCDFDYPPAYIPGVGIFVGVWTVIDGIANRDSKDILTGATLLTSTVGGGVGGWFAGRALGKALRKKLGL